MIFHEQTAGFNTQLKFANMLELILDQAHLGLIFVDSQGTIRFMNRVYEEMIGVRRKDTYGKHITEYFPDSRLPGVLKSRKAELGWKYKYRAGRTLIVNRIPVQNEGQLLGAIAQCIFKDISEFRKMASKLDLLKEKKPEDQHRRTPFISARYCTEDIKGSSNAISLLKKRIQTYAKTESTVLITGETGTGKELVAHSIHEESPRRKGPFVCINCASIPGGLFESEMFGYGPGAFTSAQKNGKFGKIELAAGGTLFLDEIGDLSPESQAKLLRVIEEKKFERVGETSPIEIDFRLVAATNKNLRSFVDEGKFRLDLFHRISAVELEIPPLRERIEDIPILIEHFLQQASTPGIKVSPEALHHLMAYAWPGNVRELKNEVELYACTAEKGHPIDKDQLSHHIIADQPGNNSGSDIMAPPLQRKIRDNELQCIQNTLSYCRGNKSLAAKQLGISRSTLYNKMRKYGIYG